MNKSSRKIQISQKIIIIISSICSYNFIVIDFSSCQCVCLIRLLTVYTLSKLYFLKLLATELPGVVSVFPNERRKLHTTHSWDFMGLVGEETMEISGHSTKNQVNVVIGFIDTGQLSLPFTNNVLITSFLNFNCFIN